jgi:protein-tyrosine phosphatase
MVDRSSWRLRAAWAALYARRTSYKILESPGSKRVLVVCYGNIYRSPFAAEKLKLLAPELDVRSAGFHPVANRPSPRRHIIAAMNYGVDLSAHVSRTVIAADRAWADIVVLMDRANWARLRRMGFDPDRLLWLGALEPGPVEIVDPYSLDDECALAILRRMSSCVETLASALR